MEQTEGLLLTEEEIKQAIAEHLRALKLNGYKPNIQDAKYAIAQAQFTKCQKHEAEKDKEYQELIKKYAAITNSLLDMILEHKRRIIALREHEAEAVEPARKEERGDNKKRGEINSLPPQK